MAFSCKWGETLCLGKGHLDQNDLRRCGAENLKAQVSDLKDLTLRRDAGMVAQDVASDSHKVLILGECQTKLLVDIIDLHTSAEDEGTVIKALGYTLLTVMLILDISEELLDDILKRHHTCRTAKLVDDDCDTLLFCIKRRISVLACMLSGTKRAETMRFCQSSPRNISLEWM